MTASKMAEIKDKLSVKNVLLFIIYEGYYEN